MGYTQGNNPISRKTSPLNANNPFKRVSPLNMAQGEGEEKMSHKEMRKAGTIKEHKAKFHGTDPRKDKEIMEENLSQEQIPIDGLERRSSSPLDLNGEELDTYKNLPPEEISGYDDGAGDFDYEAMAEANSAPGAQFDDETANKMLHAAHSINYDKVVSSGGADLGIIKNKSK